MGAGSSVPTQTQVDAQMAVLTTVRPITNYAYNQAGGDAVITEREGLSTDHTEWGEDFTNSTTFITDDYYDGTPLGIISTSIFQFNVIRNYYALQGTNGVSVEVFNNPPANFWATVIADWPGLITNHWTLDDLQTAKDWVAEHYSDDKYITGASPPSPNQINSFADIIEALLNTDGPTEGSIVQCRLEEFLEWQYITENSFVDAPTAQTYLIDLLDDGTRGLTPGDGTTLIANAFNEWNTNIVKVNSLIIDFMKVLYQNLPQYNIPFNSLQPSGIAPDYLLKPDPSNNPSEDIPRLPDWDYSIGTPWSRPNDNAKLTAYFTANRDFRFDADDLTLTSYNVASAKYETFYFTLANYRATWLLYLLATTPTPPLGPNGDITRPWPSLGTMPVSGAYNYSFTFNGGNPSTATILVASMTDTTGWGRPIPAPTQIPPPYNNYVEQTGAWLRAYWTGILRRTYNFATQFPTFSVEYDIELDQNTTAVSLTMTNLSNGWQMA